MKRAPASVTPLARVLAVAALASASASCQLFVKLQDCATNADCPSDKRCSVDRHLCIVPPPELCNGVDDDLDGVPDTQEDFGVCPVTVPPGQRACNYGHLSCDGHTLTCVPATSPATEDCTNGLDDDCDGIVDNGGECVANYGPTPASSHLVIGSNDPAAGEGDDMPAHEVCLGAFTLDRYEVTMAAFARFLSTLPQDQLTIDHPPHPLNPTVVYGRYVLLQDGSNTVPLLAVDPTPGQLSIDRTAYAWAPHDPTSANLPAVNVTWYGAQRYCAYAGKHLPTEAEFFRAVRSGSDLSQTYPWGNQEPTCDLANIGRGGLDGGPCQGAPVAVNALSAGASHDGVYNLYGNANEWMFDYLDTNLGHTQNNYYSSLSPDGGAWCNTYPQGPTGPTSGSPIAQPEDAGLYCVQCRFARGRHYRTVDLRIGIRRWLDADRGEQFVGFRCSQGGAPR